MVVDSYLDQSNLLLGLSLSRLTDAYQQAGGLSWGIDLAWVIVSYLVHQHAPPSERSRAIFGMYETYLATQGIEKPSEIAAPSSPLEIRRHVFFLRHICTPDVMDSSL